MPPYENPFGSGGAGWDCLVGEVPNLKDGELPSLKLTVPLKIDPWKRRFLLEIVIFRGELLVSGRVYHNPHVRLCIVVIQFFLFPEYKKHTSLRKAH